MEALGSLVKDRISAYCEREGFPFVSRFKTAESVAEKIETGRFQKWSDLDDIFACIIIIPTLEYEVSVLNFLHRTFEQVDLKQRGSTQNDPSMFRFDSTRFIGRVRESAEEQDEIFSTLLFEVQVRSAFEHAWSAATHALAYKGQQIDWKVFRLTAQLKAAVEQLDNLILGFNEVAKFISEQHWPEVQAKKDIELFFRDQLQNGMIPTEVIPASWTRFCENTYSFLMSSRDANPRLPNPLIEKAMTVLSNEIHQMTLANFPRSISLLQFVIGVLIKEHVVSIPLRRRYVPLITEQLLSLYPDVGLLPEAFNFELFTTNNP
jgi:ppGpp synthetase/RelA/SpoT-type nucleotidyltranferase